MLLISDKMAQPLDEAENWTEVYKHIAYSIKKLIEEKQIQDHNDIIEQTKQLKGMIKAK
jgi:hypothetical protein